jgi:hypothetical protein
VGAYFKYRSVPIASQGRSVEEARRNLIGAIKVNQPLFFPVSGLIQANTPKVIPLSRVGIQVNVLLWFSISPQAFALAP